MQSVSAFLSGSAVANAWNTWTPRCIGYWYIANHILYLISSKYIYVYIFMTPSEAHFHVSDGISLKKQRGAWERCDKKTLNNFLLQIIFVRIRYCFAYTIASLFVSVKGKHGAPILLPLSASGLAAFQPYIFHTQNNTKYSVDIKWLKTSLQSLLTIYFADSDLMRAVKIITKMFKILTLTCCFFRLVSSLPLI